MEDTQERNDAHGGLDGSVGEGGAVAWAVVGCWVGCGRVGEAGGAWGGDGAWRGTCRVGEDEWAANEDVVEMEA